MSAAELVGTWSRDQPEWHAARRSGVTATEIAVLLGLSPYNSPFNLYWTKTGEVPEQPDNDAMSLGRHLEPWVADRFAQDHPELCVRETGTWRSRERPWQLCNPDRLLFEPGDAATHPVSVLEVKTDASYDGWGQDGTDAVPVHYRCQVQWTMDVLGLPEARLCCLFLHSRQVRHYTVPYDPDDCALMRSAARRFLRRLERRDPPPVDHLPATTAALKALHPALTDEECHVSAATAQRYLSAVAKERKARERRRYYENRLRAQMGPARVAVSGEQRVATRSVYDLPEKTITRSASTVDKIIPARGNS